MQHRGSGARMTDDEYWPINSCATPSWIENLVKLHEKHDDSAPQRMENRYFDQAQSQAESAFNSLNGEQVVPPPEMI